MEEEGGAGGCSLLRLRVQREQAERMEGSDSFLSPSLSGVERACVPVLHGRYQMSDDRIRPRARRKSIFAHANR